MEVKTFRAGSIQEALQLVRQDLGPDAAVLQTREVRKGLFGWWGGGQVEVTAARDVNVPSRLPPENAPLTAEPDRTASGHPGADDLAAGSSTHHPAPHLHPASMPENDTPGTGDTGSSATALPRQKRLGRDANGRRSSDGLTPQPDRSAATENASLPANASLQAEGDHWNFGGLLRPTRRGVSDHQGANDAAVYDHSNAERPLQEDVYPQDDLSHHADSWLTPTANHAPTAGTPLSDAMFALYTDMIDAELSEELARDLLHQLPSDVAGYTEDEVRLQLHRLVSNRIRVCGPIRVTPGTCRVAALVGPTGVGKTTTIAKLAANFHLRERHRVGLITVDTYRIAAVEQLRTYADIINLPMEVVSTPREMRQAVQRLRELDLVLLDTAGRSPQDEVRIQELRSLLSEARPDEVHLVLSSVSSQASLRKTAERFDCVGTTSLLLTKLDEATGLGNLLPLLASCQLPVSYVTMGQNVPDDIASADSEHLARIVLGSEAA